MEGGASLIDDEVKAIAFIMLLVSATVAIYPILEGGYIVEPFSELGILGPNGKLGDYPRELTVGQEFNLFLYVGNHEGVSGYYRVISKLGDQFSNVSDSNPLNAPITGAWETILENESNTTIPIKVGITDSGLNRRLVFELWKYDADTHVFVYNQRWTQLWLNVTVGG